MSSYTSLANPGYYLHAPGVAKIADSPVPEITHPHDVVIRIAFVGVCGSDVHFWTHGGIRTKITPDSPLILGHEASGTVHAIGSAVTTLHVGDKVAIEPGVPCRRCHYCKSGKYNFCPEIRFAGAPPGCHGCLVRYHKTQEDYCYVLPEGIGLREGPLVEPLAVAVHVVRMTGVKMGEGVVVFGAGTIGLLCVAVVKAMGVSRVFVVDVNRERLEFARKFVGCETYLSDVGQSGEEIAAGIKAMGVFDGRGADVVLEATGVQSCIQAGIHILNPCGRLVQAGLGKEKIEIPIVELSEKEIKMVGSFRYGPGDFEMAMQLVREGKVKVGELISSVVPFEKATEAWEKTRKGKGIKNLIAGPE